MHSIRINRQMLATTNSLGRGANKVLDPYRADCGARQSQTDVVQDRLMVMFLTFALGSMIDYLTDTPPV